MCPSRAERRRRASARAARGARAGSGCRRRGAREAGLADERLERGPHLARARVPSSTRDPAELRERLGELRAAVGEALGERGLVARQLADRSAERLVERAQHDLAARRSVASGAPGSCASSLSSEVPSCEQEQPAQAVARRGLGGGRRLEQAQIDARLGVDERRIREHAPAADVDVDRRRQRVEVPRASGPCARSCSRGAAAHSVARALAERALELAEIAARAEDLVVLVDDAKRRSDRYARQRAQVPRVARDALAGALEDRALERRQHRAVERPQRVGERGARARRAAPSALRSGLRQRLEQRARSSPRASPGSSTPARRDRAAAAARAAR